MVTPGLVMAAAVVVAMLAGTMLRPSLAALLGALLALAALPLSHLLGTDGGVSAFLPFVPLLPAPAFGGFLAARVLAGARRTTAWSREVADVARARAAARRHEAAIIERRRDSLRAQEGALNEINVLAVKFGQCDSVAQVREEIVAGALRALGGNRAALVPLDGTTDTGMDDEIRGLLGAPVRRTMRDGSHLIAVPLPGITGHLWRREAVATWRTDRAWTDTDLRLLFALSEIAGSALQAALLAETIDNEARRDGLTGLLTRKAFEDEAHKELSLAARARRPLAFALLDLDHFKNLNDEHGHEAGDAALKAFAQVLAAAAEPGEEQGAVPEDRKGAVEKVVLSGRMGGEEFGLLAPGVDGAALMDRIAAIRRDVADHVRRPEGAPLTFSAGIAVFPGHGLSLSELFDAADKALYHAKAAGRNQTQEFRR